MRMPMNLVSVLLKIPKTSPRCYYVNIRRSHELISRGHVRSNLQLQKCCKIATPSLTQIRKIRATEPRRALHPLLLLLLRPISKFIAIISGRIIRKWWRKLTPEEKKIIWSKIRGRKSMITAWITFAFIILALYYYDHVVETPLTKRKRFIMITEETMRKISEYTAAIEIMNYKREIVPPGHPFFQRASRVTGAIIHANRDIPEMRSIPWSIVVIDRPDMANASCTGNGQIFVFTGILNVCTNDDQLAIVLSHEMAHAILGHQMENFSEIYLVETLLLIPSFVCWVVFTDLWAIMSEYMKNLFADILIHLPFNRTLEKEADMVGLLLAAKACFDVTEALRFWAKMAVIEKSNPQPEWLSTHPTGESRQEDMKKLLPAALKLREESNCSSLKRFNTWLFT